MEDSEKLKSTFVGAANHLTQLYTQSLNLQKQSYSKGYGRAMLETLDFVLKQANESKSPNISVNILIPFLKEKIFSQQNETEEVSSMNTSTSPTTNTKRSEHENSMIQTNLNPNELLHSSSQIFQSSSTSSTSFSQNRNENLSSSHSIEPQSSNGFQFDAPSNTDTNLPFDFPNSNFYFNPQPSRNVYQNSHPSSSSSSFSSSSSSSRFQSSPFQFYSSDDGTNFSNSLSTEENKKRTFESIFPNSIEFSYDQKHKKNKIDANI